MNTLHFDHRIAGGKTLWMIRFPENQSTEEEYKEHLEFIIPSPFGKDDWIVMDEESNKRAALSLKNFQNVCEEVKRRCVLQIQATPNNPAEQSKQLVKELENLTSLIRYFNEIMKGFRGNLPPESPDKPEN